MIFFGNKLTTQTQVGTAIALLGTWLYTESSKKKPAPKAATGFDDMDDDIPF